MEYPGIKKKKNHVDFPGVLVLGLTWNFWGK